MLGLLILRLNGITPRISSKSGALASDELHRVPASTANEWDSAKNNLSKEVMPIFNLWLCHALLIG